MSASSESFILTLPSRSSLRVRVFDARLQEIPVAAGTTELSLARGLYSVRVSGPGVFEEQIVRLDRSVDLSGLAPKRASAAPMTAAALDYAPPSEQWSREKTRVSSESDQNTGMFIFVRAFDGQKEKFPPSLALALFRADGSLVTSFNENDTRRDITAGWLAFSAALSPGEYRLRSGAQHAREMSVHVFPGLQTQVFLFTSGSVPILRTARVFLTRQPGFRFGAHDFELVEDGIAMLADPSARLPQGLVNELLSAKFDNPMLGLIGAHLLLRENRRAERTSAERCLLPAQIVDRLETLLGPSPDVRTLRLASLEEASRSGVSFMFPQPPMLLAGVQLLLEAVSEHESLVYDSPVMEDIVDNVVSDSVWTTWHALLPMPFDGPPLSGKPQKPADRYKRYINQPEELAAPAGPFLGSRVEPEWVRLGVLAAINQELSREEINARAASAVSSRRVPGVSVAQLARQLDTTPQRVDRALRELNAMGPDELGKMLGRDSSIASIAGNLTRFILPNK